MKYIQGQQQKFCLFDDKKKDKKKKRENRLQLIEVWTNSYL